MTKSLNILPEDWLKPGKISFKDIAVCQYDKTIAQEKKRYSKGDFLAIYHDMLVCHTFETVINEIKLQGKFEDVEYKHPGPAHLSLGQAATAVGAAFNLDMNDFTFGSHRSHSEILAKGLSAIRKLDDAALQKVMEDFFGGITLDVVKKHCKCTTVKELAKYFLVYGAYAEIFARVTGFNKGWGGSMHCFFTPFGIYPNNAIVGGSGPVAPGAALFKLVNDQKGIVLCNIGDASFGCGPVWEGMMFSAMGQFKTLWKEKGFKGLPILFNCSNNGYGMGGQTASSATENFLGETMPYGMLARIGAGVDPDQMFAERVNGYDPLAVADAVKRQKDHLLKGEGPALLDVATYRIGGHSPSDASSYRTKEELDIWKNFDAIKAYRDKYVDGKVFTDQEAAQIEKSVHDMVKECFVMAIDKEISPYEAMDSMFIENVMFSNKKLESCDESRKGDADFLQPLAENEQFKKVQAKKRFYADETGKPYSKMLVYNICDAVFEAMTNRFSKDPTMVAFGEDNRDWGGAYACYRGLTELLPYHRFFNSPISEAAIIGSAVGYALAGGRAVAEIMYCDFIGRCGDELFNQLSKWQAMSGGVLRMPVVVRISVGFKYGAQHSQDWSSIFNHIPGLKVCYPVTPYDAKGMLNSALAGTDPVIFLESQQCYSKGEMFHQGGVPTEYYEIPIGEPDVKKAGKDLTIITLGPALYKALDAAKELEKYGIDAEVIDLRAVNPLNYDKLVESVKKTGKVVMVNEAVERGNVMQNVAATLSQLAFDYLDAPIAVVGSRNWVSPAAELESKFFPQVSWILDTINERIMPLKGYAPSINRSLGELARTSRQGV
ncbi:MAG: thiamine pyrophosphate-dependent enzyme [Lentisphaeria bacterium]|nr:thiamine pyrophosphate-dependent enzyme [Lentisphaeria bacterium]